MSKAVINIFGYIGPGDGFFTEDGVTLASVQAQIDQVAEDQDTITVRISSYGGSVDEGEAIYSALKNSGKKVEVEIIGQAYSIASVIAMAADPGSLRIAENGKVMIHQAWTFSSGNADQLEDVIEELREIDERIFSYYMKRPNAKANENTLREYFAEEKILNADKAIELGLADSLIGVVAEAKFYPFRAMNTLPKELQSFNNKSNMKKLEDVIRDGFKNLGKQLNALRGVKDAAIETDKGPLYYEGDTIEAGVTAVFSDEAMTVAAEDGTYTYDGNEYTVAGGIVTAITPVADPAPDPTPAEVVALRKKVKDLEAKNKDLEATNKANDAAISKLSEDFETLKTLSLNALSGKGKVEDDPLPVASIAAAAARVRNEQIAKRK